MSDIFLYNSKITLIEMELKEGQSLKYNGSSKISKISKIVEGTVYFTDNSRASVELVRKSYSEPSMSELITDTISRPIANTQNTINENNNQSVTPQSFEQNSINGLVNQIKNFNPNGYNQPNSGRNSRNLSFDWKYRDNEYNVYFCLRKNKRNWSYESNRSTK